MTRDVVAIRTAKANPISSSTMPMMLTMARLRQSGAISERSETPAAMIHPVSFECTKPEISGTPSIAGFVINHNTDNTLATLRYRLKDVKMLAAEDSFKIGDQSFNAGSFIISVHWPSASNFQP